MNFNASCKHKHSSAASTISFYWQQSSQHQHRVGTRWDERSGSLPGVLSALPGLEPHPSNCLQLDWASILCYWELPPFCINCKISLGLTFSLEKKKSFLIHSFLQMFKERHCAKRVGESWQRLELLVLSQPAVWADFCASDKALKFQELCWILPWNGG